MVLHIYQQQLQLWEAIELEKEYYDKGVNRLSGSLF